MLFNLRRAFSPHLLSYRFGLIKFNLPDLGQKIKEGTIKKLYVSQGDQVTEFQKLADVASDKQFTEITAADTGIIKKIYYQEEEVCQVGDLFLQIQTPPGNKPADEELPKNPETQINSEEVKSQKISTSSQPVQTNKSIKGEVLATPFVRNLLKKNNIDAFKVKGTGQSGRILESDVEKYLKAGDQSSKKTAPQPTQRAPRKDAQKVSGSQKVSMNNFEKGMQKSMTESNKIPHLYFHEEYDVTETEKMRKIIKHSNPKEKITIMGILIKTFSLALSKYPRFNATYEPEKNQFEYALNENHNVSIAIDSPNGLVVPNIKQVQNKNLIQIQSEMSNLVKLAGDARLSSTELGSGTVCLSNIGTIGGINACPLILPPQVCIVAIGKLQVLPRFNKEGTVVPRSVINVSFGCDHRVVDGGSVARFSNQWKRILENPYLALVEMS